MIYKKIGKTVIVTDEETVYTMVGDKEQRESLVALIDKLDTMKSPRAIATFKKKNIFPLLTLKAQAEDKALEKKVTALKGEKKLNKKKAAEKKEPAAKNETKELQLAASLEEDLKVDEEKQELKDKNSALEEENRKLREALDKTKSMTPVQSNVGVRRTGEH